MLSRFTKTRAKTIRARRLRRDSTEMEKQLWRGLQRQQIGGVPFRRQHPLGKYIVDFYAPSIKLAVECDGGQHAHTAAASYDSARTAWLSANGIIVLRYWNSDIAENVSGVLQDIARVIQELKKRPLPNPPLSGEGKKIN